MKVLDLFSGIGGFSLGLERAGFETVAFCEYDKAAQKVLKLRWPNVPIYPDIRELSGNEITADVITGGYPCQPFSVAGKRGGATDDRHLWPEMYRIIKVIRPRWVIAENVAGHISMGLDTVLSDMEAANYTCWPFVIPACAVDAKHRRDRVWIICHTEHAGRDDAKIGESLAKGNDGSATRQEQTSESTGPDKQQSFMAYAESKQSGRLQQSRIQTDAGTSCEYVSDAISPGLEGQRTFPRRTGKELDNPGDHCRWETEPSVGRVAHGIPDRVDRLKQLGNSVVPQIPYIIGRAIMAAES